MKWSSRDKFLPWTYFPGIWAWRGSRNHGFRSVAGKEEWKCMEILYQQERYLRLWTTGEKTQNIMANIQQLVFLCGWLREDWMRRSMILLRVELLWRGIILAGFTSRKQSEWKQPGIKCITIHCLGMQQSGISPNIHRRCGGNRSEW